MTRSRTQTLACATWIALILLTVWWEGVGAPLREGGSALVLKGLPLLLPLLGLLHGRLKSIQWASLLTLPYLTEGLTRAWADPQPSAAYALAEALLCVAFLVLAWVWLKRARD
ncbi:MAG: DUF2069 domain-containing protein [Rhodocyclaceae bacterium]|nr:DUF2069 domain-containing protein [Rhodocyclaceae bacterium]